MFEFLFKHVVITESRANQLQSMGKDDSSQRHFFKKIAGLTDQEEALLKSVASDHETSMTAFRANAASVASGLRAQYPGQAQLPAAAVQQLQALDTQKSQITQSHMASLQSGMPAADFQRFYNFAWGIEGSKLHRGKQAAKGATKPQLIKQ